MITGSSSPSSRSVPYRPALRQPAQRASHHPPPRRVALLASLVGFSSPICARYRSLCCRSPCPERCWDASPVGFGRSSTIASRVAAKSLSSRTLAPATFTTESGPPSASTSRERFTPFLARSVGLGPVRSPQNGTCPSPRRPVPLPVHPVLRTPRPSPAVQDPKLDPPLESGPGRRETPSESGSTGSRCEAGQDDGVEDGPLVHARATGPLRRVVLGEDWLDPLPQLVRHAQIVGRGFSSVVACSVIRAPPLRGTSPMIPDSGSFEIVTRASFANEKPGRHRAKMVHAARTSRRSISLLIAP